MDSISLKVAVLVPSLSVPASVPEKVTVTFPVSAEASIRSRSSPPSPPKIVSFPNPEVRTNRSRSSPPYISSLPAPPVIVSLPAPPMSVAVCNWLAVLPVITSLPAPASIKTIVPAAVLAALMVSFPDPVMMFSMVAKVPERSAPDINDEPNPTPPVTVRFFVRADPSSKSTPVLPKKKPLSTESDRIMVSFPLPPTISPSLATIRVLLPVLEPLL